MFLNMIACLRTCLALVSGVVKQTLTRVAVDVIDAGAAVTTRCAQAIVYVYTTAYKQAKM